ncbi:MAG: hypothetical protein ACBZ72_10100 [Candidatus Bathyarchaeia archaeon]|jgi:hypothetical protein
MRNPHAPIRIASGKDKLSFYKIAVGVLAVVLVGVLVAWQAPAIGSFFGASGGSGEYTQLNLAAGQYVQYAQGNSTYVFSYELSSADTTGLFYVVMDSHQTRSYPATAGAVYHDLGLEIKVSSVTSNLAVLQVKPTST